MKTSRASAPTGIVRGLPNDEYHASPGISNSGLGLVAKSPWHYFAWTLHPDRPERAVKPGQLEGELAHCAILEPDEFDKRYVVGPTVNRNTKIWKEWCAAEKTGRVPIQAPQRNIAFAQKESVWALPDIAQAIQSGDSEVSAFWADEETGVLCRCRPDFVHEAASGDVVLIDVKTFSDASPDEFSRQVARKSYHRQAAFYTDGYEHASGQKVLGFIFVAVETAWPYASCAVMLDEDSVDAGRRLYRENLNVYAKCLSDGNWPSYSSAIELIRLSRYALGEQ